jgi:hypothetical protein
VTKSEVVADDESDDNASDIDEFGNPVERRA